MSTGGAVLDPSPVEVFLALLAWSFFRAICDKDKIETRILAKQIFKEMASHWKNFLPLPFYLFFILSFLLLLLRLN